MSKKKATTQQANFKLSVGIVAKIRREAKANRIYPAHVIERRVQHSYVASPVLPKEPAA